MHRCSHVRAELTTGSRLLLADVHQRKCDIVLVWKLDRLGRSLRHLLNILAELEGRGVAFVSLRDNLDLSAPAGCLMFNVIGSMAEFERALIQEGVRARMRNARAKGKRIGRPRIGVDGRRVVTLRDAGGSWSEVCLATGLSKGTAQRAYQAYKSVSDLPKNPRGPISSAVWRPIFWPRRMVLRSALRLALATR
jgi:DNA invertase Pin-like site-specific DNA recombinase